MSDIDDLVESQNQSNQEMALASQSVRENAALYFQKEPLINALMLELEADYENHKFNLSNQYDEFTESLGSREYTFYIDPTEEFEKTNEYSYKFPNVYDALNHIETSGMQFCRVEIKLAKGHIHTAINTVPKYFSLKNINIDFGYFGSGDKPILVVPWIKNSAETNNYPAFGLSNSKYSNHIVFNGVDVMLSKDAGDHSLPFSGKFITSGYGAVSFISFSYSNLIVPIGVSLIHLTASEIASFIYIGYCTVSGGGDVIYGHYNTGVFNVCTFATTSGSIADDTYWFQKIYTPAMGNSINTNAHSHAQLSRA